MKFVKRVPLYFGFACSVGIMAANTDHLYAYINEHVSKYASAYDAEHVNVWEDILKHRESIAGETDTVKAEQDTALRSGKLANGLTYFVQTHNNPEKEAKLKLIVMAGSLQEDDDQRGYAHFVEHMAFNGTASFEKNEIIDYFRSIGLKFGAHVNAYTTFDRTVYELSVPTDNAEYVSTALKVLSEWAGSITFDSAEVVAERGVVTEEWRARKSKYSDLMEAHHAALNAGSRFHARTPIGTPESIANAQPAALKRFYKDWYRPNLMAVVFVGDYNSQIVESEIKTLFSGLKNPDRERKIEKYSIPYADTPVVSIIQDSLVNHPTINYMIRFPKMEAPPEVRAREGVVFQIFSYSINQRLQKLARSIQAPFRSAMVGGNPALDGSVYFTFAVVGREKSTLNGLESLMSEVNRIARFGLDTVEFDRIKKSMLTSIEKMERSPRKHNSGSLAELYTSRFLGRGEQEIVDSTLQKRKELIPTITQEEVKRVASLWKHKENRYFLISVPAEPGTSIPETESLLSVIDGIEDIPLTAYEEKAEDELPEFVGIIPEPGNILEKIEHSDSIQEWKLSNGITVWLRPQPMAAGIVQIFGQSKGGYFNSVDKFGLIPAATVNQTVGISGAGKFTAEQLGKMLRSRDIHSLSLRIGPYEETANILAKASDIETALQLMHLHLNEPRIDTALLEKERIRALEDDADIAMTAEGHFNDTVKLTMANYHPYTMRGRNATPDSLNPEASLQVFKDRYSDMSDFDFIITGDFNERGMDTLVRTYIASLPGRGRREKYSDVRILPPTGHVKKRVYGANSASAMSIINFSGAAEFSKEAPWEITVLAELIRIRLTQILREDMGGVYSPAVRSSYSTVPDPRYSLEISFASDPSRADELVEATIDALKWMQDSLMSDMYVGGVRTGMLTGLDRGKYDWLSRLRNKIYLEYPISEISNYEWVEKITPETIRAAARKLLDLKNYKLFQLFPGEEPK